MEDDWAERLRREILGVYPDIKLQLDLGRSYLVLAQVVVPKRGEGVGTDVMNRITAAADAHGVAMALTPTGEFGGNVRRLGQFYRRWGFAPKSRGDGSTQERMIRPPSPTMDVRRADAANAYSTTVTRGPRATAPARPDSRVEREETRHRTRGR